MLMLIGRFKVSYQVKTNSTTEPDALISGLFSGADVWIDGDFDKIRVDVGEITLGTSQRYWKIEWFLFLLGVSDARLQVVA